MFDEIVPELANQYVLSYSSTNEKQDDSWRDIKVRVRNGKYQSGPGTGTGPTDPNAPGGNHAKASGGILALVVIGGSAVGRRRPTSPRSNLARNRPRRSAAASRSSDSTSTSWTSKG